MATNPSKGHLRQPLQESVQDLANQSFDPNFATFVNQIGGTPDATNFYNASVRPSTVTAGVNGLVVINSDGTAIGGGSGGGGTQYAEGVTTSPATGTVALGRFLSSPPTLTTGQLNAPMLDANGNLKVAIAAGGGSGGTASTFGSAFPATGTAIGVKSGATMTNLGADSAGNLNVNTAALTFPASTNNSSTSQLAAGATFTGAIETILNQQAAQVEVFSDQPYTLFIDQFIDVGGTKLSSTDSFTRGAGVPYNENVTLPGNYFRLRLTNNGTATTTTLQIDTTFGIMATGPRTITNSGNNRSAVLEIDQTAATGSGLSTEETVRRLVNAMLAPPWFQRGSATLRVDLSTATGTIAAVTTVSSITNVAGVGGVDPKLTQINDGTKNMWANAVRSNVA